MDICGITHITKGIQVDTQDQIPQDSSANYCDHLEDAIDLWNLRLVLKFLVSESKDDGRHFRLLEEQDNPNIAYANYRIQGGKVLSALERINRLIQVCHQAQDDVIFYGDIVGVNDVPYFRDFLSMIPNPSRVWEIPEGSDS
jgi:hypothetical protein